MAAQHATEEIVGRSETRVEVLKFRQESSCTRCGGLMVPEFCTDLLNGSGSLDCSTLRCVQCGDVVDPVIRWNRHLQQAGAGREMNTLNQALHRQPCV
jgi:hypothetical protein